MGQGDKKNTKNFILENRSGLNIKMKAETGGTEEGSCLVAGFGALTVLRHGTKDC
jgi:hypothetical protein